MFKKIKALALNAGVFSLLAVPLMVPAVASADNIVLGGTCNGTNVATESGTQVNPTPTGTPDANCTGTQGTSGISSLLKTVVNIFSIIVGFVAVVMIIYGGFKYITSGGDSSNISGAKNTIVYAIIGLVVVALAQIIVRFVIAKSNDVATSTGVLVLPHLL